MSLFVSPPPAIVFPTGPDNLPTNYQAGVSVPPTTLPNFMNTANGAINALEAWALQMIRNGGTTGTGGLPFINVQAAPYNAKGDGVSDDGPAINAVFSALRAAGGGMAFFPFGVYATAEPLNGQDLVNCRLMGTGPGSFIVPRAGSTWTATQPLLNLSGATMTRLEDLNIVNTAVSTLANAPAAGLVLGRTATNSGSNMFLTRCLMQGIYQTAAVYVAAAETLLFLGCTLQSQQGGIPCLWDGDYDLASLTGRPLASNSNTRKSFYNCFFTQYAPSGSCTAVLLKGNRSEIAFRDCYGSLGGAGNTTGGAFIEQVTNGVEATAGTTRMVLDNVRVEGQASANARLIYEHDGDNGIINLETKHISWNVTGAAYCMEFATALSQSKVDLSTLSAGQFTSGAAIRFQSAADSGQAAGAACNTTEFRGVWDAAIVVDGTSGTGSQNASCTHCLVVQQTGTFPFTGGLAGNYETTNEQNNLILNLNTAYLSLPSQRTQPFTLPANNVAPSVTGGQLFETANTSDTAYTGFTGQQPGQRITLLITDAHTSFVNSAGLVLAGGVNYTAPVNSTISFQYDPRSGGAWWEVGRTPGVASVPTKIAEVLLGSAALIVAFNAIPATYRSLRVDWSGRSTNNAAGAGEPFSVQINTAGVWNTGAYTGDAYQYVGIVVNHGAGTPVADEGGASSGNGAYGQNVGWLADAAAAAGYLGAGEIEIPNYASATLGKVLLCRNYFATAIFTSNTDTWHERGVLWPFTTAINSLVFSPGTGVQGFSFDVGTYFALWGIP